MQSCRLVGLLILCIELIVDNLTDCMEIGCNYEIALGAVGATYLHYIMPYTVSIDNVFLL